MCMKDERRVRWLTSFGMISGGICELSYKLKVSAGLQVGLISKYTEVTEASQASVSTMAYHTMQKQYDQDMDLS